MSMGRGEFIYCDKVSGLWWKHGFKTEIEPKLEKKENSQE